VPAIGTKRNSTILRVITRVITGPVGTRTCPGSSPLRWPTERLCVVLRMRVTSTMRASGVLCSLVAMCAHTKAHAAARPRDEPLSIGSNVSVASGLPAPRALAAQSRLQPSESLNAFHHHPSTTPHSWAKVRLRPSPCPAASPHNLHLHTNSTTHPTPAKVREFRSTNLPKIWF